MLLRGSFLPPLPLPEPAISLAPSYPVALLFHHNDEMDVRWSCDHQRTLSSRRLLVTEQANSRGSTQGRAQERAYERKEVPSSNKGKKDYWTSKSVAHARISGKVEVRVHLLRVQCSKTPRTLSISSFPLARHLGSRRDRCALDLDDDRTSCRAGGRLFGGTPRDHGTT